MSGHLFRLKHIHNNTTIYIFNLTSSDGFRRNKNADEYTNPNFCKDKPELRKQIRGPKKVSK